MERNIRTIKRRLVFFLIMTVMFTGYGMYTREPSCAEASEKNPSREYYTVQGSLLQDKSDNKSMGDSGINKPMELINENGKWKLRLELKSLKAKVGGFKGYLGRIEYFPDYEGKDAPKGKKATSFDIESYHDVWDEYNDATKGTDAFMKGKRYPHYCKIPIEMPANGAKEISVWVRVYVPVMESLQPGKGTQYARLHLDLNSMNDDVKALSNNPPDKGNFVPAGKKVQKKKIGKKKRLHKKRKPGQGRRNNENNKKLDIKKLQDGTYAIKGRMVKTDKSTLSMGDSAINHTVKLRVKHGKYNLVLRMKGMSVSGQQGFLKHMRYYADGYRGSTRGSISGNLKNVKILSYHQQGGKRVRDSYGTDYPSEVSIPMIKTAADDGYVPLQVFVPVMDAIAPDTGTQSVYLKLDLKSIRKAGENSPEFSKDGGSSSGNTVNSSKGSSGGATLGTFKKEGENSLNKETSLTQKSEISEGNKMSNEGGDDIKKQKEEKKEPPMKKHMLPGSITIAAAASLIPAYKKRRRIFKRFVS